MVSYDPYQITLRPRNKVTGPLCFIRKCTRNLIVELITDFMGFAEHYNVVNMDCKNDFVFWVKID